MNTFSNPIIAILVFYVLENKWFAFQMILKHRIKAELHLLTNNNNILKS